MNILVTGATGRIGSHLVHQLLSEGHHVRALTRHPDQAQLPKDVEVVQGDLTDTDSLRRPLREIEAVHLITFGGDYGEPLANGADIIALAEQAGVQRASVLAGWAPTSIEEALEDSFLAWSRVEPVEVMYNTTEWSEEIRDRNTVSTLATYPSAIVHEADIADVLACVITQDGHAGQNYRVTGPEALTPAQRTEILSQAIGRPIRHVQLTEDQERARLATHGLGDDYVEFGIQLATNPPEGAGHVLETAPRLTKHAGRTFEEWARTHTATW